MRSCTAISFIFAIRLRLLWIVGMKERGQVGVYLINGLENGIPDALE
ncbi:unknown [Clostridium sp. CAG:590]|nr:unknown [Clostridium sp. CAG:590]